MKKILFAATMLLALSCSQERNESYSANLIMRFERTDSDLESTVKLKKSTNLVGDTFRLCRITNIGYNETATSLEYTFTTDGPNYYASGIGQIPLSGLQFYVEDNALFEKSHPEIYLTSWRGEVFINRDNTTTNIKDLQSIDTKAGLLLQFYDEISTDHYVAQVSAARPCDWKNQVIVTGWGFTSGGAQADMEQGILDQSAAGQLDCTPLDSSPRMGHAFGGSLITASVSFCCDGRGGGGGSW